MLIFQLVVKVYNDEDPTSKTIAIDQTWTAWEVSKKMMIKNDADPDPNWSLVERLSELCIGMRGDSRGRGCCSTGSKPLNNKPFAG